METKKFCPYCMSPVKEGEPCAACGLTEGAYTPAAHHLPPGTVLMDRYLIGRVLGEGGFGITYIGCDLRLEMKVAIKEYFPVERVTRTSSVSLDVNNFTGDNFQRYKDKFLREARAMARMVKLPEIVAVRDYFEANNTAYIVMEYVEGTTMRALVEQRGGGIPAEELLSMMKPLFLALGKMHKTGLIHRDISPENLMLENGNIRLLDFGCARESASKTETLTITLKYGYAPIEQYQHHGQGPWTDVYALAATIYFCLTGQRPPQAMDRVVQDELVPPRKLGVKLTEQQEKALLQGMAVRPTRRFQSMEDFHEALYSPPSPPPPPPHPSWKLWLRAHRAALGAGVAAIAAVVLIAASLNSMSGLGGEAASEETYREENQNNKNEEQSEEATEAATIETDDGSGGEETDELTEEQAAEARRAELNALFENATTFSGDNSNWEELRDMLNDDSIPAVIISNSSPTLFENVIITKPVLVDEASYLGAWGSLFVDGENAVLYVKGQLSPSGVLRTVHGGSIVADDVSNLNSQGTVWLENESDLEILGGDQNLGDGQVLTCDLDAPFAGGIDVSTAEEFAAACNDENIQSITVTGDITLDAGGENNYYVSRPIRIAAGASLTVTNTSDESGCGLYSDGEVLVNCGTLNAFVNTGSMTVLLNEDNGSWRGGCFNSDAVIVNRGYVCFECSTQLTCQQGWYDDGNNYSESPGGQFYNHGYMDLEKGSAMQYVLVGNGLFYNNGSFNAKGDFYISLGCNVTAFNTGLIHLTEGAELRVTCLLKNYGDILLEGGNLINNGVLWQAGTLRQQSGGISNNGAVVASPYCTMELLGSLDGFYTTLPVNSGGDYGSTDYIYSVVTNADQLYAALNNGMVEYVVLEGNVTVDGDLYVGKPLYLRGNLEVGGTMTVSGYIVQSTDGQTLTTGSIVLENGATMIPLSSFHTGNLTVGEGSVFYAVHAVHWNYLDNWIEGSLTVQSGGTFLNLSELPLEGVTVEIQSGGLMGGNGDLWLTGCNVTIDEGGYLYLNGSWSMDENTTLTNNGTVRSGAFSQRKRQMYGYFVNNGKFYGTMDIMGTVENHGSFYGDRSDYSSIKVRGGQIVGDKMTWTYWDDIAGEF